MLAESSSISGRGGGHAGRACRNTLGAHDTGRSPTTAARRPHPPCRRGRRRPRRRAAAHHPRHRPALPDRRRPANPTSGSPACVMPAAGHRAPPALVVPRLEAPGFAAPRPRRAGRRGRHLVGRRGPATCWSATSPGGPTRIAVADSMPAAHVLRRCATRCPTPRQTLAGPVLRELRMRKDAAEVAELRAAGAAIDRVHARMARVPQGRAAPRSRSRADIAAAIVEEGHTDGGVRDRRLGPERRQPAPRRVGPGDRGRRRRRDRHRRPAAERLQLRLHPHLRRRAGAVGATSREAYAVLQARPGAGGGAPCGPA